MQLHNGCICCTLPEADLLLAKVKALAKRDGGRRAFRDYLLGESTDVSVGAHGNGGHSWRSFMAVIHGGLRHGRSMLRRARRCELWRAWTHAQSPSWTRLLRGCGCFGG
jgi:hypothetical protein